jgi:hypothetical protein
MGLSDLCNMSGIVTLYHKASLPSKVSVQLANLVKTGLVEKVQRGQYAFNRKRVTDAVPATVQAEPLQHLQLEVSKRDKTVSFIFEGLQITVKVLP